MAAVDSLINEFQAALLKIDRVKAAEIFEITYKNNPMLKSLWVALPSDWIPACGKK